MNGSQKPFRLPPRMPVGAYVSYEIRSPRSTHSRPATCAEVECEHWLKGWVTRVDVTTELGVRQARYITEKSGRAWTCPQSGSDAPIREFRFPPGQKCFSQHFVPLWREPLYIVRDGDWRGNPTGQRRQHHNAANWVEDFALHQIDIKDQVERG